MLFRSVVRLRVMDFLKEAGRIILLATVVLWGLLSYPAVDRHELAETAAVVQAVEQGQDAEDLLDAPRPVQPRVGKECRSRSAPTH